MAYDRTRINDAKKRVKEALINKKQEIEQTAKQAAWDQHTIEDARAIVKMLSDGKATIEQIDIAISYLEKDSTESLPISSHLEIILATAISAASNTKPSNDTIDN